MQRKKNRKKRKLLTEDAAHRSGGLPWLNYPMTQLIQIPGKTILGQMNSQHHQACSKLLYACITFFACAKFMPRNNRQIS